MAGETFVTVKCPCGEVIDLPITITPGAVENGNLSLNMQADTTPRGTTSSPPTSTRRHDP